MATVTNIKPIGVPGDLYYTVNDVTLGEYATGGVAVSLSDLGFGKEAVFSYAVVTLKDTGESEVVPTTLVYDGAKLSAFGVVAEAAAAEVADEADLSEVVATVTCYCSSN
jgi:hypothetical protein